MTKNELVREVAVSEKLLLSTATQAVDGIIRVIKQTLAKGEPVIIRGFGTFQPYQCNERPARNSRAASPASSQNTDRRSSASARTSSSVSTLKQERRLPYDTL